MAFSHSTAPPAVIRESMRLFPAVTGRTVVPLQDTTLLNGKYQVKEGDIIRLLVMAAQRDTAVWGADVGVSPVYAS
jgi:cytochrome P450